ncbi:2-hydroxyhepta-24-diene-17-dioate isomerase [Fusarium acutatum]|uniref:Fumarylacetoacetase n=1 Tax=Fusarium acutatum TaxID=78861 RepID=A0A8H4JB85_9HYPO|nr:2-hydroxyhepta-24-diene-17-dioate isomerase [Fusarium acutatum]
MPGPRALRCQGTACIDISAILGGAGIFTIGRRWPPGKGNEYTKKGRGSCGSLDGVFTGPYLNDFAALPTTDRNQVRATLIDHLSNANSPLFTNTELANEAFIPLKNVQMHMPVHVSGYSDFFGSYVHAENGCRGLRIPVPDRFYQYPMGYNGRCSSVAVSGTDVERPFGFFRPDSTEETRYQATQRLDFEVEIAAIVAQGIELNNTVTAKQASDHIFGYVLLNDWSARDLQVYEMPPFGPFHSKAFLSSISPWVVTLEALKGSPAKPPPTIKSCVHPILDLDETNHGVFNVDLTARVSRSNGSAETEIVRTNWADAYWSMYSILAYQASSGCGLGTGDLLGSGTLSSPDPRPPQGAGEKSYTTFGCLAEVQTVGHNLPDVGGEKFEWLEDGDRLTIDGWFTAPDGSRAGFGGVAGTVKPARRH